MAHAPCCLPSGRIPLSLRRPGAALALLAGALVAAMMLPARPAAQTAEMSALLQQLDEGNAETRRSALQGLAERGDFSTVPRVAKALHDPDPGTRLLAERALWAIWSRSGDEEVDALYEVGARLLVGGREAESVLVFTRIIQRKPDFAEGWNKRATAYYQLGQYEKSLEDIAETLQRNPFHFGALSGAGLCLIELERYDEALEYLNRALEVNPNMDGVKELRRHVAERVRKPMA